MWRELKLEARKKLLSLADLCSVEGKEQICEIAEEVKQAGGCMLRGGAYKPERHHMHFRDLELRVF